MHIINYLIRSAMSLLVSATQPEPMNIDTASKSIEERIKSIRAKELVRPRHAEESKKEV
jgi:hypothetical protein